MEQQVNLYQPILRAEKRLFSAAAIAIGLALLVASLGGLAAYAGLRTTRAERAVAALEQQQVARLAALERGHAELDGGASVAQVEASLAQLADAIAMRERALAYVDRDAPGGAGFATRLEAFARPTLDGLWLRRIVVDPERGVALAGLTRDPELVPVYLAALQGDAALAGVRIERFELRRAEPADAPAAATFSAASPGLGAVLAALDADDANAANGPNAGSVGRGAGK